MKLLLTGPTGQVGSALLATLPKLGQLTAAGRSRLDLMKPASIMDTVQAVRPDVIVNAAAYTAVDQAETEESIAMTVNCDGPALLAAEAAKLGALLVHFSTDYVFDGEKTSAYLETDAPNPINAYGRSKLAGEEAIRASGCRYLILRTSWVYAVSGKNFLLTILRRAREGKELRVVDDQRGAPTSSIMIANATPPAILRVVSDDLLCGLYHMSAAGSTTWFRFARAIVDASGASATVHSTSSSEYPAAARRPRNSLLDNTKLALQLGVRLPPWETGMHEVLPVARAP